MKVEEIVCGKKTIAVIDQDCKEAAANGRAMRAAPELLESGKKMFEFIGWLIDEDRLGRDEQLLAHEALNGWADITDRAL